MKKFCTFFLAVFALLTVSGCVTQKKKGADVGWFKKGYHNLTTKYNYWFNADELFRVSSAKMEGQYKDNYTKLLEIYPARAVDPQSVKADMDNVVKKSSTGVALHRVSDWADDCYMLIGAAQYMKQDFETAESTFRYFKDEFDPNKKSKSKLKTGKKKKEQVKKKKKKSSKKKKKKKKTSKKKKKNSKNSKSAPKAKKPASGAAEASKKDAAQPAAAQPATKDGAKGKTDGPDLVVTRSNPYKKGMKRTAAYPEAMIWFGRTLTEREKYDEADFLYRELWEDPYFPSDLRDELATAEAYLQIKQKNYDKAVAPLEKAISFTRKRKMRARLAYILAQLSERANRYDDAYKAYDKVLAGGPSYEMEFNARLRQIQAGWSFGKTNSADANRALERLLKDDKNTDYRDQIYYTLADIALKDKMEQEAIAYLRLSLRYNKSNTIQRAESYLKLADLYFDTEDFVNAKNYFDSTLTVLPATDERYKIVSNYADNLSEIARLIKNIVDNDSIVRVYRMSDADRKALAKSIQKQRNAEALAAAKTAATAATTAPGKTPTLVAGSKSSFYFYNEAFVKKGRKEFVKTWGERKLEDNWRRSKRSSAGASGDEIAGAGADGADGAGDVELGKMFESLPKNDAELAVLHVATYEAMYQLGTLFRDKIEHNRRCSATLEEMQTRYPDQDKYEKETWYYCHIAFRDLNNTPKAKYYLDKLAGKYPNTTFARALTDPNFINSAKERDREVSTFYDQTFALFQGNQYQQAFARCQEAPSKFGSQNPLMAKFALLGALCVGNLQGNDAYCKALGDVIGAFPAGAEATRAKEIARVLGCKGFEVADSGKPINANGEPIDDAFTREDDKLHYVVVAITGDIRLDDVKNAVSDYNREFHKLEQLRISSVYLGTDTNAPILVIRKFDNKEQSMRYYNEVKGKKEFLGEKGKKTIEKEVFAITQENYRRILKNKTLDGYREFFQANYF
jgi:tetratricopeptide (TPR) repeat protein